MNELDHARRTLWLFMAAAVIIWNALWLSACLLIISRMENSIENRVAQPTVLAMADALRLGPPPFRDSFKSYLTWAQQRAPVVKRYWNSSPFIRYVVVWSSSGTVALLVARTHAAPRLISTYVDHGLPPRLWPSHPGRRIRIIHPLPWKSAAGRRSDMSVPISWPGGFQGHLSVGFATAAMHRYYWRQLRRLWWLVGGLDIAGALAIVGLSFFVGKRLDKSQRQQIQAMRARTSLLSERGMLASVLAHEVRSPLTALRFNLHFLRTIIEGPLPDAARQLDILSTCQREMRRLDAMLDDFLLRTQVVSEPEETAINTVVRQAMDFLNPSLQGQGIRVISHLDPTDPKVMVSSDELRQVLLNLSTNAQEAMGKGGTLAISTLVEPETVVLLVRDSGKGIPLEVQSRLFEPFFSTKPRGSGLGLALVRRVVSGAGGSVYFESIANSGTTFRVVLPRVRAPAPPDMPGRRPQPFQSDPFPSPDTQDANKPPPQA